MRNGDTQAKFLRGDITARFLPRVGGGGVSGLGAVITATRPTPFNTDWLGPDHITVVTPFATGHCGVVTPFTQITVTVDAITRIG